MLAGLDTSSRLVGYAVGDGSTVPLASAWSFDHCGDRLGKLAAAFEERLSFLVDHFGVRIIIYEAPILLRGDTLAKVRKLYGMGWHVEWFCHQRGIKCYESSVRAVKKALAGDPWAKKPAMVKAAARLGVQLPKTLEEGREDAADAVGVWLTGVQWYAPEFAAAWAQRVRTGSLV